MKMYILRAATGFIYFILEIVNCLFQTHVHTEAELTGWLTALQEATTPRTRVAATWLKANKVT